jgi:hypothetical protein
MLKEMQTHHEQRRVIRGLGPKKPPSPSLSWNQLFSFLGGRNMLQEAMIATKFRPEVERKKIYIPQKIAYALVAMVG